MPGRGIAPRYGAVPSDELLGRIVEDVVAAAHNALARTREILAIVVGAIVLALAGFRERRSEPEPTQAPP